VAGEQKQKQEGFYAAARDLLDSVRAPINATIDVVAEPLLRDGTLAAAFRQGAEELWQGLKAFPDTIQVHEPGTILSPTQGEIAADRRPETDVTLDNILAMNTPHQPEQDHGKDQGLGL
jgi:hypothetical protein